MISTGQVGPAWTTPKIAAVVADVAVAEPRGEALWSRVEEPDAVGLAEVPVPDAPGVGEPDPVVLATPQDAVIRTAAAGSSRRYVPADRNMVIIRLDGRHYRPVPGRGPGS